ncbi:hypothetical protein [Acidipila sp. EB88]|uniref:hypothetical protein n=1 Tax=Acidipila sp. EB88 TaxID=2305226 RepID=UPI001F25159B|nr:hypothetical protein [Acidipila sp. EB88]
MKKTASTHTPVASTLGQECVLAACAAAILSFIALAYCARHGMLLLYGDAVAHLHIARRLSDSLYPGFRQLGSVWLPLPHLLIYPFARSMEFWQSGLAGAPPSMLAYVLGVAGVYRLARVALGGAASFLAALFYAANPSLLYLQCTAMTEPIFLAEIIWAAVFVTEHGRATLQPPTAARERILRNTLMGAALVLFAAVFTRYDGWIVAALAWCVLAWNTWKSGAWRGRSGGAFLLCTAILLAAPAGWLAYNAKQFGDPLDFMRGPYSAKAIDARTSAHGAGHYPGWHNMPVALLYFAKAAELDATDRWVADLLMLASLAGTALALRARRGVAGAFLLLWLPLPFYMYSVAYGSVPIFLPRWYPHGWYNTRYGMELLPAFALSLGWLAAAALARVKQRTPQFVAPAVAAIALLFVVNDVVLIRERPLVLGEAYVNSHTRIPFETELAHALSALPPAGLILMYTSDHVGAVQQAGIPLVRTVNDSDWLLWRKALKDPAHSASYVVGLDGDAVAAAVQAHGEGLTLLNVICSTGQPCARIYKSTVPRTF